MFFTCLAPLIFDCFTLPDIVQLASCWESRTHQDKLFTEVENAPFLSNTGPKEDWVQHKLPLLRRERTTK